jgi:hypothetical protein
MRAFALITATAAMLVVLAVPAAAAVPTTRLTVTTTLEGGRPGVSYTLACGPPSVRGLPKGVLGPLDACRALVLVGDRLYRPRLSTHIVGCNYIVATRRATIVGYRLGRRVRTMVEVGGCERLLVSARTLARFVVWNATPTR